MKKATFFTLAAAALLTAASASQAAVTYTQTSTTGLTTSYATPPTVLDDITLAAGSTAIRQELSALTFGVGVLAGTTAQTAVVFFDFYDTFNAASTGSVVTDYLGGFGGNLTITANTTTATALRAFTFNGLTTLASPIFFNDPNLAVVITLADGTGTTYSSALTPLTSVPGTPTVGASTTGVYRDANADGVFQATEFVAAQGNLYLSLTTVNAAVPEPSTYALCALGLAGCLVVTLRRRQAEA